MQVNSANSYLQSVQAIFFWNYFALVKNNKHIECVRLCVCLCVCVCIYVCEFTCCAFENCQSYLARSKVGNIYIYYNTQNLGANFQNGYVCVLGCYRQYGCVFVCGGLFLFIFDWSAYKLQLQSKMTPTANT